LSVAEFELTCIQNNDSEALAHTHIYKNNDEGTKKKKRINIE